MVHIYNFREVETEGPGRSQCWCQCYTESWRPAWTTLDSISKNNNTHYYSNNKKEPWSLFTWLSLHPLPPLAFSPLFSMLSFLEAISILNVSNYILHSLLNLLVWHFHYPAKKVSLSRSKNSPKEFNWNESPASFPWRIWSYSPWSPCFTWHPRHHPLSAFPKCPPGCHLSDPLSDSYLSPQP